jgi:hypothetical protein
MLACVFISTEIQSLAILPLAERLVVMRGLGIAHGEGFPLRTGSPSGAS